MKVSLFLRAEVKGQCDSETKCTLSAVACISTVWSEKKPFQFFLFFF